MAKDAALKEKKSGNKQIPIILAILVVGVSIGFFTANFMIDKNSAANMPEVKVVIPDSLDGGLPNYEMVMISNIAVNPVSTAKRPTLLALSMAFQIKPLILGKQEFDQKAVEIKDMVNTYLASKTVEFYRDPNTNRILKTELRRRINKLLKNSEIINVYITDMIMQ